MKKITAVTTLTLVLLSLILTAAFALNFEDIYMVSGPGNTTQKTDPFIFEQEQPWIFLKFSDLLTPEDVLGNSQTTSYWTWDKPTGIDPTYFKIYTSNQNGVWGSLDNWATVERVGNWSISVTTSLNANPGTGVQSGSYTGNTQFTVAVIPEPASTLLCILGGAAFGVGLFRKRKSKSA